MNQNVAIHCSTKEEWDKIINLFPSNVSVDKSCWGSIVNGRNSDTISINGYGWSPKKHYEGKNYTIYPASDFLEKQFKEQVQFEVGKWYKYTREDIIQPSYAKYSSKQSFSYRFYYDEFISVNGYKKGHNWSFLSVKPVLLTDLSEIQQYLPDGHSDKISFKFNIGDKIQTKKGGYYIANPEYWNKNAHSNLTSESYGIMHGVIEDRKNCQRLNWYKLLNYGNWITEEGLELQEKPIDMFQQGDYIVLLKKSNNKYFTQNYIYLQCQDYCKMYTNTDSVGERTNGGAKFKDKDDWRYATSEEIVEYERLGKPFDVTTLKKSLIGRYLKALVDSPNGGLVKKGEYGLITDENLLHVDFESQKNYSCTSALDYPEHYELMPIEFLPPNKKEWIPEPGEWVVMIRPYPELEKGKAYQIVKQQLKNNKKYWVLDHNGETNSFSAPEKDTSFRKALPHEIPSLSLDYTEYDGKDRYNFNKKSFNEDINIILINKQKRQLPVITIESPTYLDLKLKTTKPKQIQIIKI